MDRLHTELQRLYLPAGSQDALSSGALLSGADGTVRALVLSLSGPSAWESLGAVWRGVQADLDLPAPAIAVSGHDACQLWFSLSLPMPAAEACSFLEGLRHTYLAGLPAARVGMAPSRAAGLPAWPAAVTLPPREVAPGRWSAFLAADLAALFDEEACLDLPPPADAQADLLSRVHSMGGDDWRRALQRLGAHATPSAPAGSTAMARAAGPGGTTTSAKGSLDNHEPRTFLLQVMNDPTVEMHLRIEAAKALLHGSEARPR